VLKFRATLPTTSTGVINAVKILLPEDSRSLRLENERALQRAREEFPDVILLDLMLPRISGLQVLRRLRRMAETPVVVGSGLSGKNRGTTDRGRRRRLPRKNAILPDKGVNLLPKVLEDVMCRIGRKHGVNFKQTPTLK
jgi:CheY-like chemotaxis protein